MGLGCPTQISVLSCILPGNNQYTVNYQILATVDTAWYLGVTDLSGNLNFNAHIKRITSSANKTLGLLKRNIRTKHTGIHEAAYQTILSPHVEYASTVWSPYIKQGTRKVELVQRRAITWTKNNYCPHASVTNMQENIGRRSLEQRRSDVRMIMLFKIIHGLIAIPLPPYTRHSPPPTHPRSDPKSYFISTVDSRYLDFGYLE